MILKNRFPVFTFLKTSATADMKTAAYCGAFVKIKYEFCISVATEHVAAARPARSRSTTVKKSQADPPGGYRRLQGRYRHRHIASCSPFSHLIILQELLLF